MTAPAAFSDVVYPDTAYARRQPAASPRPPPRGVIEAETAVIGGGLA